MEEGQEKINNSYLLNQQIEKADSEDNTQKEDDRFSKDFDLENCSSEADYNRDSMRKDCHNC